MTDLSDQLRAFGIKAMENLADYCDKTEHEKDRLVRIVTGESDEVHAYEMGRSYYDHGPDGVNCHFSNFRTTTLTAAWEKGFKEAKADA